MRPTPERERELMAIIRSLLPTLRGYRRAVAEEPLRACHQERDYQGMAYLVRSSMRMQALAVRVEVVRDLLGPWSSPAWIQGAEDLPLYGMGLVHRKATIYLREALVGQASWQLLSIVLAHELAHAVLASTHHSLKQSELAVDVAAMMLGYHRLYRQAFAPFVPHGTEAALGERVNVLQIQPRRRTYAFGPLPEDDAHRAKLGYTTALDVKYLHVFIALALRHYGSVF